MKKGFTLVEIMIVVAIIGLLAAIAIPSFMKARLTSQKNACINNLRQIESGKDQYAIEKGGTNGHLIEAEATVFTNLVGKETGYIKAYPFCPASASTEIKGINARTIADYTCNPIGSNPVCKVNGLGVGTADHILP